MSAKKLLTAVKNNKFYEVSEYLASENDEDVNTIGEDNWSLLNYAVMNENVDMVKALLKNGADPTQATDERETPLHVASRKGCMEIVSMLLNHASACKIDYINNKTTSDNTPLHYAAKNGFTDIVISLLSHGAIYNIQNNDGYTPSILSYAYSVRKILNLIEECFDKAQEGNMEVINILKDASVDEFSAIINARNCKNQPLIQVAMVNHHHKLATKLLEMSVDLDARLSDNRRSVAAIETLHKPSADFITIKEELELLKTFAEKHLSFSNSCLSVLRSMSIPYGSDQNLYPWKTLKEGSYLLGNTQGLIDLYKKYNPGNIRDEDIKLINDTLVHLQFESSHISLDYTQEAFGGELDFVANGQGTVYCNMLHSDLNKDVRLFIDIVEKNLNTPVKRFLEKITQKIKMFS